MLVVKILVVLICVLRAYALKELFCNDEDFFYCGRDGGDKCIPIEWTCDYAVDCPNGKVNFKKRIFKTISIHRTRSIATIFSVAARATLCARMANVFPRTTNVTTIRIVKTTRTRNIAIVCQKPIHLRRPLVDYRICLCMSLIVP